MRKVRSGKSNRGCEEKLTGERLAELESNAENQKVETDNKSIDGRKTVELRQV